MLDPGVEPAVRAGAALKEWHSWFTISFSSFNRSFILSTLNAPDFKGKFQDSSKSTILKAMFRY